MWVLSTVADRLRSDDVPNWVRSNDQRWSSVCRVPLDPLPDWVEPARRAVGLRIAVLRHRAGLSQERLAERAFLERKAIIRYETGVRTPSVVELLLIADALGVPVASLFADPHEE